MSNDGVTRTGVTTPRLIDHIASLPVCVQNRVQPRSKPHKVACKVTHDLLHRLKSTHDVILSRGALPRGQCPLSQLMEHPNNDTGVTGSEHYGNPAPQKRELTPGGPKTRGDLMLQLL